MGGLAQGGGWGTYIRQMGLTCDSVADVEMVNAKGKIINTATDPQMSDKEKQELLWAIRGGGGGNFGVITRFLFNISDLPQYQTTFSISWTSDQETVKTAIRNWVKMHRDTNLTEDLSCTASLSVVKAPKGKQPCDSAVVARVGGSFFGTADELLPILIKYFPDVLPLVVNQGENGKSVLLMIDDLTGSLNYFNSWNERAIPKKLKILSRIQPEANPSTDNDLQTPDIAAEKQYLADFMTGLDITEISIPALANTTDPSEDQCARP